MAAVHAGELPRLPGSDPVQVRPFRVCVPPGSGVDSDARVAPGLDFVYRSPFPLGVPLDLAWFSIDGMCFTV
jgi:hypothetical protein